MTLYELHARRTCCYDRKAEMRVRLKSGHGRDALTPWVNGYLAKYPDGVVTVYEIYKTAYERRYWGKKKRKCFTFTNQGVKSGL